MLHNFLVKIAGFVVGVVSLIFPIGNTNETVYQAPPTPPTVTQTAATASTIVPPVKKPPILSHASSTLPKQTPPPLSPVVTGTKPVLVTSVKTDTSATFDSINENARKALVNILCTTQVSGPFSSISGSGVVISPDGIIITNAHLGQYFLLKDFNGTKNFVQCTIRTGSPAYPTYKAELIYISPTWVEQNSKVLVEENPTGTGEHDYAFLKITSKIDGSAIDQSLPYLPINFNDNIQIGENTLLASYPAGFLGGISIERDLFQTSAITQISDVFTFGTNTIDVISIPGTVISQRGSSGGAVVDDQGKLVGIITTSSDADTTGARDLRAITLPYINRDLNNEASTNLQYLISNSNSIKNTFTSTIAATLTKILTDSILEK